MSIFGPRAPSRSATLLIVAAVHGLVLWGIWRVRAPVVPEIETFASVLFFIPEAASPRPSASISPRGRTPNRTRSAVPATALPAATASGTAITLPAAPAARIDWRGQLAGIARDELDQEEKARKQLRVLTRRFEGDPDPLDPGRAPASTFRWYEAGIHHIDTRGSLPVLQLNDRCVMLLFILPFCRIGHIESHGDLFDGAAQAHAERLATPRPNDVP
jgi:hypothetical protein